MNKTSAIRCRLVLATSKLVVVLLAVLATNGMGFPVIQGAANPSVFDGVSATKKFGNAWFSERWTGDDLRFRKERERIGALFRNVADPGQLAVRFIPREGEKRDAFKIFGWAVAHWENLRSEARKGNDLVGSKLYYRSWEISNAMASVSSPRTREWARMRAFLEHSVFFGVELRPVFLRLHRTDPSDTLSKLRLVLILTLSRTMRDLLEAKRMLAQVKAAGVEPLATQYVEAVFLFIYFDVTRKPADAAAAITAIRKYRNMLPANGTFIVSLDYMVNLVNEMLKESK